jgi:hypothetical protein
VVGTPLVAEAARIVDRLTSLAWDSDGGSGRARLRRWQERVVIAQPRKTHGGLADHPITGSAVAIGQATNSDPTSEISHGGAENLCSTALHTACQSRRTASSGTTSSKKLDVRPKLGLSGEQAIHRRVAAVLTFLRDAGLRPPA